MFYYDFSPFRLYKAYILLIFLSLFSFSSFAAVDTSKWIYGTCSNCSQDYYSTLDELLAAVSESDFAYDVEEYSYTINSQSDEYIQYKVSFVFSGAQSSSKYYYARSCSVSAFSDEPLCQADSYDYCSDLANVDAPQPDYNSVPDLTSYTYCNPSNMCEAIYFMYGSDGSLYKSYTYTGSSCASGVTADEWESCPFYSGCDYDTDDTDYDDSTSSTDSSSDSDSDYSDEDSYYDFSSVELGLSNLDSSVHDLDSNIQTGFTELDSSIDELNSSVTEGFAEVVSLLSSSSESENSETNSHLTSIDSNLTDIENTLEDNYSSLKTYLNSFGTSLNEIDTNTDGLYSALHYNTEVIDSDLKLLDSRLESFMTNFDYFRSENKWALESLENSNYTRLYDISSRIQNLDVNSTGIIDAIESLDLTSDNSDLVSAIEAVSESNNYNSSELLSSLNDLSTIIGEISSKLDSESSDSESSDSESSDSLYGDSSLTADDCSSFTCNGDAAVCYLARRQWEDFCEQSNFDYDSSISDFGDSLDSESSDSEEGLRDLLESQVDDIDDNLSSVITDEMDLTSLFGKFTSDGGMSIDAEASCPSSQVVSAGIVEFTIDYSPFCEVADLLSSLLIALSTLVGFATLIKHM